MKLLISFLSWVKGWFQPRFKVVRIIDSDLMPSSLPRRGVVLLKDDGENWAVGFKCPCGCGENIQLLIPDYMAPSWQLVIHSNNDITLNPSVWMTEGCRSHFWIRKGKVVWVH